MIIIIVDKGQEVPRMFNWIFSGLGHWISIVLVLSFIIICMEIIANDDRTWKKKKKKSIYEYNFPKT